jgi:hypothetical protein
MVSQQGLPTSPKNKKIGRTGNSPVKKVSVFLRNWNASWMPSYRLQSTSVLRRFYMGLPLLEAIDLRIDFQKGGNYHNPKSQAILNYLFCL